MKINRVWAMPSMHTFTIQPIRELIYRYGGDFSNWIDPFAGDNSPAEITNDLNPEKKAEFHMAADEFVNSLKNIPFNGVLFDPPYSPRQIKEMYEAMDEKNSFENTQASFWSKHKQLIAPKIKTGGIAICCGWNSGGFGKNLGFELMEILLVAHGGAHHDTIVTVERKFTNELF